MQKVSSGIWRRGRRIGRSEKGTTKGLDGTWSNSDPVEAVTIGMLGGKSWLRESVVDSAALVPRHLLRLRLHFRIYDPMVLFVWALPRLFIHTTSLSISDCQTLCSGAGVGTHLEKSIRIECKYIHIVVLSVLKLELRCLDIP